MSYTEYLRRKAAAAPKIVDTTLRLDASSYTQRVKFAASRQVAEANIPNVVPVVIPAIVSVVNTSAFGSHNTNTQIVFDPSGNLYINARDSRRIYKMTPDGVVTVFAGSGANATTDGIGIAAAFMNPSGICIDSTGTNMYVAETSGQVIRKIEMSTVNVTTFAGSGVAGNTDGTGLAATFNFPGNLTMDASDNIYTVDAIPSGYLRRITPGGIVTRIDDGVNSISSSISVACDKTTGFIYTAALNRIVRISPAGVTSVFAGLAGTPGYQDGIGTAARFTLSSSSSLAFDSSYQNLYVMDNNANRRIRAITIPGAVVSTFAGSGASGNTIGPALSASFTTMLGIGVDASNNVFLYDNGTGRLNKIAQSFTTLTYPIPVNKTKAGGRIPDASTFTQYTAGQAVGKEIQADVFLPRITLNSNAAGSLSGCAPVSDPIAYIPGGTLVEFVTTTFTSITGTAPNMTYNINPYTKRSIVPSNGFIVGSSVTVSGTGNQAGNNGTFTIVSVTATSFTVSNASGVADATPLATQTVRIPFYSLGAFTSNMVPLTGSQQGRNALMCRQLQGEPHRPNELGPSLFVDNTIVGIKNYNLPQNNSKTYIATDCIQCGTNGTEIGKTCAFCIGANHLHCADMPHNTRWGPRPRKSAQPIIVNSSPSDSRKIGNFAPRHIPYVEKHHGNAQPGHIVYTKTPYRILARTLAQLKINDAKNIRMV